MQVSSVVVGLEVGSSVGGSSSVGYSRQEMCVSATEAVGVRATAKFCFF